LARLIVFDLDGTLVDSRRDLADAANAVLAEHHLGPLPEESIGRMVGDGAATLVSRAFAATGSPQPPEALRRFLAIYDGRLLEHTRPYENVASTLKILGTRALLAVLTNKPLGATRRILDGLDLSRYFSSSRLVGGDGPLPRKPDPSGLRHLLAVTRVAPAETFLVGDSMVDVQTAIAGGVRVCLARYGFGFHSLSGAPLPSDSAVIDRFSELIALTPESI
jgi:phosphoglycolate phosphatase